MVCVEVEHLDKSFGGVAAISDLTFKVQEGIIFSVIGPNGAGKTTLFNLLTGLYRPSGGAIRIKGKDIRGLKPHEIASLGVTRTFQNLQVFMNMTVLENVMVGCHMRSRSGLIAGALRLPSVLREERRVREMAMEALEFCDMADLAGRDADSLAYGLLKKLEIARALAAAPGLLLMDEPAAGLNDTETLMMGRLIERICKRGTTVLLVEHNMGLVMGISHGVLVLNYGRLLAQGSPEEVQRNPEVIAAYLGDEG